MAVPRNGTQTLVHTSDQLCKWPTSGCSWWWRTCRPRFCCVPRSTAARTRTRIEVNSLPRCPLQWSPLHSVAESISGQSTAAGASAAVEADSKCFLELCCLQAARKRKSSNRWSFSRHLTDDCGRPSEFEREQQYSSIVHLNATILNSSTLFQLNWLSSYTNTLSNIDFHSWPILDFKKNKYPCTERII